MKKRILSLTLAVLQLFLTTAVIPTVAAKAAEEEVLIVGDTDGDGSVTIIDATYIQRFLADMIEDADGRITRCGDVDGDSLTIIDAIYIQRYLACMDCPQGINTPLKPMPTEPGDDDLKIEGTIEERLAALDRVSDLRTIENKSGGIFNTVYLFNFKQYISHEDKSLGYFDQKVEFGFVDVSSPNLLVTSGYSTGDNHSGSKRSENELAVILGCNYLFVEHRYFGSSLPVEINYDDNSTWRYLSTEEAAGDYHEIVTQFKRILDGKWAAAGISKGGMTTESYAYYYPHEMDLYLPYVAPYCNSFTDTRMMEYIYGDIGDGLYGEETAREIRDKILDYQIQMLRWEADLAPRYYQEGVDNGATYSAYTTPERLYEAALLEYAVVFWQYDQRDWFDALFSLREETEEDLARKQDVFLIELIDSVSPEDLSVNGEYTPYYIQAYQELGNYRYDFSYLRKALPDDVTLSVQEEEDKDIMWKLTLNDTQLELEQHELLYSKINEMLETTDDNFIIIYGLTDPYYACRPADVDRDNAKIYVSIDYPHTAAINRFDDETREEILSSIKRILEVES